LIGRFMATARSDVILDPHDLSMKFGRYESTPK
jgi:hypothetical protein